MKERRYDVDWLRILATLTIFFFHCARFFDTFGWHLKNSQKSDFLTYFVILLALWDMPLFFVLSGFGSWYALRSRNAGQYLFERVKRLLIPLFTVGAFLLLPPQYYIDRLHPRQWDFDSLFRYVPPYWDSWPTFRFRLDEPYLTNLWSGHLWFLQFLFNVSVVTLPLLLFLRSGLGRRLIERLAGWSHRWGGIFLFLIPLFLIRVGLRTGYVGEHTWADLWEYAIFFLIGYLIAADRRFTESIKRHGWVCLGLGIAGFVAVTYANKELGYNPVNGESFSRTYVLFHVAWTIGSWSWIVFIFSLGAKYLNFDHPVLAYGRDAQLPFYLLHQTVILLVGWYVIPGELSIALKYLIICASSFALIMLIYELLLKRFNLIRIPFGMRLKRKRAEEPVERPKEAVA